jgi:hypothetical protein
MRHTRLGLPSDTWHWVLVPVAALSVSSPKLGVIRDNVLVQSVAPVEIRKSGAGLFGVVRVSPN